MGRRKRKNTQRSSTSSNTSIESPISKISKTESKMSDVEDEMPDTLKTYLQIQQQSFKSFVNVLIDSFNRRFDGLTKEVIEMKASLQYSQKDIDDSKVQLSKIAQLEEEINKMKVEIREDQDKIDYLENQSRRNNVRIQGIKEERSETWERTEERVKDLLKSDLEIDADNIEIERAHRTGKFGNSPRQIVVKLLKYKDRESIMNAKKKLKGKGIYINEDFSNRVMQRRRDQQEKLEEARKQGKIAYFSVDRLIIKDRLQHPATNYKPFGTFPGAIAGYGPSQISQNEEAK